MIAPTFHCADCDTDIFVLCEPGDNDNTGPGRVCASCTWVRQHIPPEQQAEVRALINGEREKGKP